ncbi:hypothetical protein RhiirC2_858627 [Rhizophagus irregularis]|uniref:C2H2-type domain-containing protein n=1 Tax=Rhizophagus irregularis TaxID=588596 RepID=A0A2N1M427_9GLOM|nr:hypothetical protein RhiirC2_858627 [Rhizophagus irregularis]
MSCETHMVDLMSIIKEENFHEFTHNGDSVKPFWYLLTDGGPDENPRFLANIMKYLLLFKKLDLDYLTSAYNPVERCMASLSEKLAGIELLNAFMYGNYLGSVEGKITIVDRNLRRNNFRHAGYDEHCLSDLYHSFTCQKCFRYFSSKAFLKQHTKTIHPGKRVSVERVAINVVIEAPKYLQQDYEYNAESSQDDENENSNDNTLQEFQKEKTTKRG